MAARSWLCASLLLLPLLLVVACAASAQGESADMEDRSVLTDIATGIIGTISTRLSKECWSEMFAKCQLSWNNPLKASECVRKWAEKYRDECSIFI